MEDFITELQDLRYLDWTDKKLSVGTPGCFLKAHGANIEILLDENEVPRPAPLFDYGLSFLLSCYDNLESVRNLKCWKTGQSTILSGRSHWNITWA